MRAKIHIACPEYFIDFVFAKTKVLWPQAVLLDICADERACTGLRFWDDYGYDIYPSSADVEAMKTGDSYTPPKSLNITYDGEVAILSGSADVVKLIAKQPLWGKS